MAQNVLLIPGPQKAQNNKVRRPTGKIRGFSRYVRHLRSEAESFEVPLSTDYSIDMWHRHFDFFGYGRRNWALRRLHIEALFTAFERALGQKRAAGARMQVFVSIAPMVDAEQDALYYHGPNSGGDPYPYLYPGVRWNVSPPVFLRQFLVDKPWQVGAGWDPRALAKAVNKDWWVIRAHDDETGEAV
jgi:hypothetical protein